MSIRGIIAKKRDGEELSGEEIGWVVSRYTLGTIGDAEMAALLMAIVLRGMTPRETTDLTLAMVESGERLDLASIPGRKVDKHSTGGVGDKTTLVVAPLVASLGVPVPKMSGRALGHTGGTIDKLECIPGLTTSLSPERFCRQVAEIGVAIAAQTAEMAPADKRIYALRDATGTVESVPLIASSVMSKKLAVGADGILLDVKAGRGAFMPDAEAASELARAMVEIGTRAGKHMIGLVTRMEEPLGMAVGDGAEMAEAIRTLGGRGPGDLVELCEALAGHMLYLGEAAADPQQGCLLARRALADGSALAKLREMVRAQGGDPSYADRPEALLEPANRTTVRSPAEGYVTGIDARLIGEAVRDLKSGARDKTSVCGLLMSKKVGGPVASGEPLAEVVSPLQAEPSAVARVAEAAARAFQVGDQRPAGGNRVLDVVGL